MRYVLIFWALPLGLFWSWYFLSLNDLDFGSVMLSREMHDLVFGLYGDLLGIEPSTIPPLVARACVIDTFILLGIVAFRRRRAIRDWLSARRGRYLSDAARSA